MKGKENRRFSRVEFHAKGFVSCDGAERPLSILNIALKGVLAESDAVLDLQVNDSYPLRISLPHSDINIITRATLVYRSQKGYGFRFDTVEADGMIHLRRLLELNLNSGDSIEKELTFLGPAS